MGTRYFTVEPSISAQKQNTDKRIKIIKNIISVNASNITNTDEIDKQIKELIEKVGNRQYQCKPCGKISTYKSHATEHVETHMEGLFFSCQMCPKTFRSRSTLRIHKIRNCQLKNVRKYVHA